MDTFETLIKTIQPNSTIEPDYTHKIQTSKLTYLYPFSTLSKTTINQLQKLTECLNIKKKLHDLYNGDYVNVSEKRKVNHHHLRRINEKNNYQKELSKLTQFITEIHQKKITGYTNKPFDTVIQFGIGGSELGPKSLYHALSCFFLSEKKHQHLTGKFISNVDPMEFNVKMNDINPETTLFIFASKSGSTQETLSNIDLLKTWWQNKNISPEKLSQQCIACTMKQTELDLSNIAFKQFYIDEHIGGRFSTLSVIGLALIGLCFGINTIYDLLNGAEKQDQNAFEETITQNIPLLAALIDIVQRNNLHYQAKAVIAYSYGLNKFPNFIQQLCCESNGKQVDIKQTPIPYKTSPIIFGQEGSNAQHSFFQLLHQGSDIIPVEFITIAQFKETNLSEKTAFELLQNNLLAQMISLYEGNPNDNKNKHFDGKRPSTTLILNDLSPKSLGALISYYENKVMFEGFIWNLNSFDQEGVELGKKITSDITAQPKKYSDLIDSFTKN